MTTDLAASNNRNVFFLHLSVLETRSLQLRCWQGGALSRGSSGESCLDSSTLWGPQTFSGFSLPLSSPHPLLFPVSRILCIFYEDICHWIEGLPPKAICILLIPSRDRSNFCARLTHKIADFMCQPGKIMMTNCLVRHLFFKLL